MTSLKTYSELCHYSTFEDRFNYLRIFGRVGEDTFGYDRIFNQMFYSSREWKSIRNFVISRDNGCDLGTPGYEFGKYAKVFIHHMNPISIKDIREGSDILLDPEFLISASFETHNAIHFGKLETISTPLVERGPNDTCPWKNNKKENPK